MRVVKKVSQYKSISKSHGHNLETGASQKEPSSMHTAAAANPSVDIRFESHGSIVLIRGLSELGQAWLDENVGDTDTQYFGNAICAEPRYCAAIYQGAVDAGLAVSQ